MRATVCLGLIALLLAACGGGGSESKTTKPAEIPAPALIAVDAALLKTAPAPDGAAAFHEPGEGTIKSFATLAGGQQATQVAFTPDGKYLVSIDYIDYHVRVWDWRAGKVVSKGLNDHLLTGLAVSPDGSGVWTGDAYQNLHWWPLAEGQIGSKRDVGTGLGGHVKPVISPNGRLLATVSYEKVLSLWDAIEKKSLARVATDEHLRTAEFSPDGQRLVVGTGTNLLLEYQLATGNGRKVQILPVRPDIDLGAATFSPDGKHFSTGHMQPWVTVWDGSTLTYRHWLKCPEKGIGDVAYSRDSTLLAFVLGGLEIYLWKPDVHEESGNVAILTGHEKFIRCLTFSPDGKTLASGDESGKIMLWASTD